MPHRPEGLIYYPGMDKDPLSLDLFSSASPDRERLGPGTLLLRGYARAAETELLAALDAIVADAPFRHMMTPGGHEMSVAMTNAGPLGWVTDRRGYRYDPVDPVSGKRWPALPPVFLDLARRAAQEAGYAGFSPDACLINRYEPGAKMSLHQDRDERDFTHPIVSVSLGLPAVFQWGGLDRKAKAERVPLEHGDVLAWGGSDRLRFHGILPIKPGQHPRIGACRINLTFRRAS